MCLNVYKKILKTKKLFYSKIQFPERCHSFTYYVCKKITFLEPLRSKLFYPHIKLSCLTKSCILVSEFQIYMQLEPCAGRAAADNLWAPPCAAAADILSACRRCHCRCLVIFLQLSIAKKGHQKILRLERNLFGDL